MKTKNIDLGYIHMSSFNTGDVLDQYAVESGRKSPDPKETVLSAGEYTLVIDYPLSNPFKKKFKVAKGGMTRAKLVALVIKSYKKIYADEDKDMGTQTGFIPGMLNRATSEGRYGIWGHVMEDLMLHTATVQKNGNVTVDCDS